MKKELRQITKFIDRQTWTFAKTMPESPHEYVVKTKLSESEQKEFENFVLFIRAHGAKKRYKKSNYVHFDIGGYSYWTMGAPLEITTILNRHDLGFYDKLADSYDRIFSDNQSQIENEQVGKILAPYAKGNVLDIGCGTGLLLDNALLKEENKIVQLTETRHATTKDVMCPDCGCEFQVV